MTKLEDRAVAEVACPRCQAEPGKPCTRGGAELRHPHADRAAALGSKVGAEAQARVDAGRSPGGGRQRQPKPYDKCVRCGMDNKPAGGSAQDHSYSDRACGRRQAINKDERKLKITVTKWTTASNLNRQMAEAAARVAEARKQQAAKEAAS